MDVIAANTLLPNFRKRKAENAENNERLSKRLSLLNLERDGQKACVPIEQAICHPPIPALHENSKIPVESRQDLMQIDNSKHKVYIHDLDAEILDTEPDEGKLILHPDIGKHLLEYRLPPPVFPEVDSSRNKQLILYNVPGSLTLPEEQDSVKKIIFETRARARAKQEALLNEMRDNQLRAPFPSSAIERTHVTYGLTENLPTSSFDHQDSGVDVMELDMIE